MDRDGLVRGMGAGAVAMLPLMGWSEPLLVHLIGVAQERHGRAISRALSTAEYVSGLNREELGSRIAEDPQLIPLFTRLLYTAGMTGFDEALDAMGSALGDAVLAPERVDEAQILMTALQGLSPHHAAILRVVVEGRHLPEHGTIGFWTVEHLASVTGYTEDLTNLCLAGLVNAGLVRAASAYDGIGYESTGMGVTVLAVLSTRHPG